MNIDSKLIGKRIKEFRIARGISQMLLAELCDISDPYISYIECGKKIPSLEVMIKIAKALDTSVDTLLEGNQTVYSGIYEKEIADVMNDCTPYEKRIMYEMLYSLKSSIRQNRALILNELKQV